VTDRDQPPLPYDPARARELVGNYEMDAMTATIGALTGQRGFFTRDDSGTVVGVDLAGRFAKRVPTPSK
jgi:hypothetical protein